VKASSCPMNPLFAEQLRLCYSVPASYTVNSIIPESTLSEFMVNSSPNYPSMKNYVEFVEISYSDYLNRRLTPNIFCWQEAMRVWWVLGGK